MSNINADYGVTYNDPSKVVELNYVNHPDGTIRCQEEGHVYCIKYLLGRDENGIMKLDPDGFENVLSFYNGYTKTAGVTNEQIIAVMIDRFKQMNSQFPCTENEIVIKSLENILSILELRHRDRIKRNVLGKHEV